MTYPIIFNSADEIAAVSVALNSLAKMEIILSDDNVDHLQKAVATVLSSITAAPVKESMDATSEPDTQNNVAPSSSDQAIRQKCMELAVSCKGAITSHSAHGILRLAESMRKYIETGNVVDPNYSDSINC